MSRFGIVAMTVLSVSECDVAWESASPAESLRMGEALGRLLRPGDLVALLGDLGSGKTLLVRGVAAGLGCAGEDVHSPSFTLVNEYLCGGSASSSLAAAGCSLVHIDLYRIRSEDELPAIGWDEYLGPRYVVLVEWAERALGCLPGDHLRVRLEARGPERRRMCAQATGPRSGRVLRKWVGELDVALETTEIDRGKNG
jgi:tRNA threonylcarbamoyladenosine biosynthesis protein TsaE